MKPMTIDIRKFTKKLFLPGLEKDLALHLKLLKKYGADKNSSILEIGCGEGQNALNLINL